jgi:hypothetical protein
VRRFIEPSAPPSEVGDLYCAHERLGLGDEARNFFAGFQQDLETKKPPSREGRRLLDE